MIRMAEDKKDFQPVVLPGYAQICQNCVYRDFYDISKAAKDQSILINNLRNQLVAVTAEMEKYKALSKEDKEEEQE